MKKKLLKMGYSKEFAILLSKVKNSKTTFPILRGKTGDGMATLLSTERLKDG